MLSGTGGLEPATSASSVPLSPTKYCPWRSRPHLPFKASDVDLSGYREPDNGFKTHTPMVRHEPRGEPQTSRNSPPRTARARLEKADHQKPSLGATDAASAIEDFVLISGFIYGAFYALLIFSMSGGLLGTSTALDRGIEDLLGPQRRVPGSHRRAGSTSTPTTTTSGSASASTTCQTALRR